MQLQLVGIDPGSSSLVVTADREDSGHFLYLPPANLLRHVESGKVWGAGDAEGGQTKVVLQSDVNEGSRFDIVGVDQYEGENRGWV